MKYVGFLLFLLPLCIKAQNVSKLRLTYSHVEAYSYRKLMAESDLQGMADTLNVLEIGMRAMSHSIGISKSISKKFELSAGLSWSTFGERIDTNVSLGLTDYRSLYKSVDIPIMINKIWNNGKSLEYVLGFGASYSFLIAHDVTYRLINSNSQVPERALNGLNSNFLSARMEMGIRYAIDAKWLIGLGVQGKYALIPISQNAMKRYPYQAGITLSIGMNF